MFLMIKKFYRLKHLTNKKSVLHNCNYFEITKDFSFEKIFERNLDPIKDNTEIPKGVLYKDTTYWFIIYEL